MEGNSHGKNQLDSFSGFGRTPTCDGWTDRHRAMASTADAGHRAVKTFSATIYVGDRSRLRHGARDSGESIGDGDGGDRPSPVIKQ